ncbi:Nif3-like dinuclear metal center hexameric protein [Thiosulfativibrio zosterae]|uniref:GTP cyclohydrolase 1 type 2 homolog n=1 Tax=Thiosulfativibrio zosterae TaxID=2675053 RepID=A0A6F8PMF2_9GAMM|nr:Nif3-like dinuclear metal center hexameric protein [Thiosulfativibrio zosterae]BBP43224.1 GTP cyclohydrolase 1 type 2 [Thiosulfativibrio zosterae]
MKVTELLAYCHELLEVNAYQDYAPNGLQVEGKQEVTKIVTGVTACQSLINKAIALNADMVLVHHGYFWRNESPVISGMKQKRIKSLLANDINLVAYHLPLDGHLIYGNNAQLAKLWSITDETPQQNSLVRMGRLEYATNIEDFIEMVASSLGRLPLHLPGGPVRVQKIAWCSGGAQNDIEQAIEWGADVFISGEVSEQTTHQALENGIHYLAAGHYATERLGVKVLGEHLAEIFGLEVIFVDVDNPV